MIKLKYIGPFQPNDIIEVPEEKVQELISTGNYLLVEDGSIDIVSDSKGKKNVIRK
jgi:hypothetical protein